MVYTDVGYIVYTVLWKHIHVHVYTRNTQIDFKDKTRVEKLTMF